MNESKYKIVMIDENGCKKAYPKSNRLVIENKETGSIIPESEPIFIFRAQDQYAYQALSAYHHIVTVAAPEYRCNDKFRVDLGQSMVRFAEWQRDNIEKVKIPD